MIVSCRDRDDKHHNAKRLCSPQQGVLVIPTRSNWHFVQASSPLLRNQHLWPSEFKTDHFRMFGLKVSIAALRHQTCLRNLFSCVSIDLWHLLCTPMRQACMHAFCAHRLACLLANTFEGPLSCCLLIQTSQIFSRDAQVAKCPMRESHNWKQCPYQHVSENARRRDPTSIEYTTEACPMYHHGICLFGAPFSDCSLSAVISHASTAPHPRLPCNTDTPLTRCMHVAALQCAMQPAGPSAGLGRWTQSSPVAPAFQTSHFPEDGKGLYINRCGPQCMILKLIACRRDLPLQPRRARAAAAPRQVPHGAVQARRRLRSGGVLLRAHGGGAAAAGI